MTSPDLDAAGPVPEDNQPGHRPDHDQDKPDGPPPGTGRAPRRREQPDDVPARGPGSAAEPPGLRFPFAVERPFALASRLFGVNADRAVVEVDERRVTVRFGRWSLSTPLANVARASVTGPYSWWKVAGPAHLSFADGGITFATNAARGACIEFHEPVPAMLPVPALRHGAATVTVADPEGLVAALATGAARAREIPVA